ncbi:NmrA-like family protein [Colletotrichum tofieldiae]|uniref:NmrA-like family protein n=1 Tax=Colletotrichum tofieldiae TaxID=708197 RepID=A0A166U475_9PEZI|nr:NmrA-like family protein [Colletotrichum tofieldiae]GKT80691.1 NmrA-like family protein [Colletotrichum tofieldiae]GKT88818.1 nmrA-like family protein [Colletotrichum tofieldiae]
MSQVVAVAGGTGDLGRTIVEAIIADGKFSVIALARKADEDKEKQIGARIQPVNYASVDDITKVLEENNVHTVISTLDIRESAEPELNLIAAADRAESTKRYVPSVWGPKFPREVAEASPLTKAKVVVTDALEKTSLKHSTWYIGFFADYYVSPPLKTHVKLLPIVIDVANNAAGIPGSGNVPVTCTYTIDLAKFVAASLSLPEWRKESYLISDKLTWNQIVQLIESAKGVKFNVTYDSLETLEAGKITELPGHVAAYPFWPKEQLQGLFAKFGLMFEAGVFDIKAEPSVAQDFPDIKLRSLKELLEEAWKPKV